MLDLLQCVKMLKKMNQDTRGSLEVHKGTTLKRLLEKFKLGMGFSFFTANVWNFFIPLCIILSIQIYLFKAQTS